MADLIEERRLRDWLDGPGEGAWSVVDGGLERTWRLEDFAAALRFVDAVGGLAEAQGHHPDIHLVDYREVRLRLVTHSAGGITEQDLELAERIGELQQARP